MESPAPPSSLWFLHLPGLLDGRSLDNARSLLGQLKWGDGSGTAGDAARAVKNNRQAVDGPQKQKLDALLLPKVMAPALLHTSLLPARVHPFVYNRYADGMEYGWHLDSPVMGGAPPVRTDVAMTLFLSGPETYDGGELDVEVPGATSSWKLPAGDAIFYPAIWRHRVRPVTRGERLAAITWVQCGVRDPVQRHMLSQVKHVHSALLANGTMPQETEKLLAVYSAMMRMWVEM